MERKLVPYSDTSSDEEVEPPKEIKPKKRKWEDTQKTKPSGSNLTEKKVKKPKLEKPRKPKVKSKQADKKKTQMEWYNFFFQFGLAHSLEAHRDFYVSYLWMLK